MTKPVPKGTADRVGVSMPAESGADRFAAVADAGRHRVPPMEPLLSTRGLAEMTGQREQTWRVRRMNGDGPPFVRIGKRAFYRPEDVRRWLEERRFQSTAEETVARVREASQEPRAARRAGRGRA